MTTPPTDPILRQELEKIRQHLAMHSPGEWKVKPPIEVFGGSAMITAGKHNIVVAVVHSDIYRERDDATFIANAPADLEYLLSLAERLVEENQFIRTILERSESERRMDREQYRVVLDQYNEVLIDRDEAVGRADRTDREYTLLKEGASVDDRLAAELIRQRDIVWNYLSGISRLLGLRPRAVWPPHFESLIGLTDKTTQKLDEALELADALQAEKHTLGHRARAALDAFLAVRT